jgi:hypothetical protein
MLHAGASATHRSKLLIPGGHLDDLALLHCEWTLGLDRFAALRESRLAAGVPAMRGRAELVGEHGDRWLFRFALPTESGMRTNAVRISATGDGVVVEHLVVDEDQRLHPEPSADSPETTRMILELPGVQPAMLRGVGPVVLGEREVPALVADALEPHREAPIVLISVDNATREPLVDPPELARRLAGMARVVSLSTVGASRRLKDELVGRGFSEKFGCFHGGVRILWPGIQQGDDPYDHLLLLPVRLYPIPERTRTERIAGLFCEMIAEDEDLRARLREVEAPSRPEPDPTSTAARRWSPRSLTTPKVGPPPVLGEQGKHQRRFRGVHRSPRNVRVRRQRVRPRTWCRRQNRWRQASRTRRRSRSTPRRSPRPSAPKTRSRSIRRASRGANTSVSAHAAHHCDSG